MVKSTKITLLSTLNDKQKSQYGQATQMRMDEKKKDQYNLIVGYQSGYITVYSQTSIGDQITFELVKTCGPYSLTGVSPYFIDDNCTHMAYLTNDGK